MSGFLGRYEYQLDEKGRLSLPAPFRREAEDGRFVLLQYDPPALTLFTEAGWEPVKARLAEFRRTDASAAAYVRWVTSNAVDVTPDKQGRILVPSWLQEAASLDGKALLVGSLDRVEIWSPKLFGKEVRDRAGDFPEFKHKIF